MNDLCKVVTIVSGIIITGIFFPFLDFAYGESANWTQEALNALANATDINANDTRQEISVINQTYADGNVRNQTYNENRTTPESEFPLWEGLVKDVFNESAKLNTTELSESDKALYGQVERILSEAVKNKGVRNGTIQSGGALQILSSSSYIDEAGYFHVVGELQNNSPSSLNFVQVTGTFYDINNKVVGTTFTYTNPSDIMAGGTAPFDLALLSASVPMSEINTYKVSANAQ